MKKLHTVLLISLAAATILLAAGCSKGTTTTTTTTTLAETVHTTAQSGDKVKVDYTLKLADGTVYQTTVGNTPFEFTLGTNAVIAGFETAVIGMTVGDTKTVTIPAAQAYGATPSTSNPLAGKDLTFIIKLLEIEPKHTTAQSGDTVKVDYTLKLPDGTVYQTTVGSTPFEFTLGTNAVIAGFETAVTGMKVGETKTVTIPAAQAYGATPSASNPLAGKDLTFVIKLLQIE